MLTKQEMDKVITDFPSVDNWSVKYYQEPQSAEQASQT